MVATASIRTAVRDEILTRLRAHPSMVSADGSAVPCDPGLPGERVEREHVFVVKTTGARNVVFLEAGRKTIEDNFTITFAFWTSTPGLETLEADDRVEQLSNALLDVLADDPALGDLDGLMWAVEASCDGPDAELTPEGAYSIMTTDVEVKARYE
jgi:hypothetical protein